jgi:phosphatidate cytidylyltransferase
MKNNLSIRIATGILFLPFLFRRVEAADGVFHGAGNGSRGRRTVRVLPHGARAGISSEQGARHAAWRAGRYGVLSPVGVWTGPVLSIAASTILVLVARLLSPRPVDGAIEDIASTLLGIFYVAMLFAFQVAIRTGLHGKQWLVFLYFVIWASDIGAYSIGIPFGKHRLYEKISPKKSIEGLIGALAAAAGMALLCSSWFMPPVSGGEAIALGLVLASIGTVGDLTESLFKRAAGVKDSGGIIGHGRILDRMDSMLFAAPVLYFYLGMK